MFEQFWDFNGLVEDEAPDKVEIAGCFPVLWTFGV
jgi:hypothetical protein